MFSVRHNLSAMYAHRQTMFNNGNLTKALERLSSGYRINRSADDVAGLAVSERLRTQVRGYHQAAKNIQDGNSFLQTGDAGLQNIHDLLQRMRELLVQAANGIYSDTDRSFIQFEIDELLAEIDRIHTSTQFNKKRVFDYRAADIVWIVDGTGSMAGLQAALIAEAPNFVNELNAKNIDFRVGVARFGGAGGPVAIGTMTTDVAAFQADVTAVGIGVGPAEKGMEAFNSTLNLFTYRPEARKIFVILTDEDSDDGVQPPANNSGPFADITDQTIQNMIDNDVVAFSVVSSIPPDAGSHNAQSEQAYISLPQATGGERFIGITAGMSAILAGGVDDVVGESIKLHVGANENQTFSSSLQTPVSTRALGIENKILATSQLNAENSLAYVDSAINRITRIRSSVGAEMNRLGFTLDYARVIEESEQSAESRIRDADMAAEMIEFTKAQVIVQSASAMLAQANLFPQNVLSLLG